jgi:predicted DNA-binding transcriptional regulator YafY
MEPGRLAPPSQENAMDTQTSAVLIYDLFRQTARLDRNPMAESTPYRYAPASRLHEIKTLLASSSGMTVYEIADRFGVSVRTAIRYLRALENAGEPLEETLDGKRKIWRLHPAARRETIALTTTQMVSLFLSRRVFDFLAGTGFKEDLDEVFKRLEITLRKRDYDTRNLERKIFDVNEAPHIYADRLEHVDDIITALLREERLLVTHGSVGSYKKAFVLEPYTLLVYKKGLYLAGYSHHHKSVRTFSLDGFRDIDRLKKDRFDYPKEYQPAQLVEGAFGMIGGPRTHVRLLFDAKVGRFVRRRQWHPTQKITKTERGVELAMDVSGTVELTSWILGWGDKVEVLEPESLREEIAADVERVSQRYRSAGTPG